MAKTKYQPDFPERAEKYAKEGLTEAQIAKKLGISKSSFELYKRTISDFSHSLKRGKQDPDNNVENSLFKRAIGFEYEEVKKETIENTEGDELKLLKVTRTNKLIVGDVTAQIFWLKNRRPDRWRDKHDLNVKREDRHDFHNWTQEQKENWLETGDRDDDNWRQEDDNEEVKQIPPGKQHE